MKLTTKNKIIFLAIILLALSFALYYLSQQGKESTDDAALEARTVTLSPKISGYVTQRNFKDNQYVRAGTLLLQIDSTDYQIHYNQAKANWAAAEAAYQAACYRLATTQISAPMNVATTKAQLTAAYASWIQAHRALKRMQYLNDEARSREQLDAAIATEKNAYSRFIETKAQLRSANTASQIISAAKANTIQLAAQIKQAEASLAQAKQDLTYTQLISPINGYITKRGIEKGDYVQPGQPLAYIVGDPLWVIANFKETQIQHIMPGQKALIYIDAFPNTKINGRVDSIQAGTGTHFSAFPPENATGNFVKIVQRVPVKIILTPPPDPKLKLGPGMSVVPTVYIR